MNKKDIQWLENKGFCKVTDYDGVSLIYMEKEFEGGFELVVEELDLEDQGSKYEIVVYQSCSKGVECTAGDKIVIRDNIYKRHVNSCIKFIESIT